MLTKALARFEAARFVYFKVECRDFPGQALGA
jgi:hypothetical protein